MAAVTTTTLIEAVNRVLLDVGERQVTSLVSVPARKALAYIQDAFVTIQNFHDWEWLYTSKTPDSWLQDQATVTGSRRIRRVSYKRDDTDVFFCEIPVVDGVSYDNYALQTFSSSSNIGTIPCRYMIQDEQTIKLNPYPTDSTTQSKVIVHYIQHINPPEATTDVFNMPERFMPTLYKITVSMMYARHLGDLNASQVMQQEFIADLTGFRSRESAVPTTGSNMFRTPRVGHYYG